MLPANKLANIRRRVNRARNWPLNTCPASRHLHAIADDLLRGSMYMVEGEEAAHAAGTMLSVLESLWKARTKLDKLEAK